MNGHLLDANVLIALAWPAHTSHRQAQQWFATNAHRGWATCPLTQCAFVRIISNPAFSRDALTPTEALGVLEANLKHHSHRFWPDDISFLEALTRVGGKVNGHQQVTDSYLLGLAARHKAKLATLDRGLAALHSANLELIR